MAENPVFDTENILGDGIFELSRSKLIALAVDLCAIAYKERGENAYRGGIRPDNISIDADSSIAIGPAENPNKEDCSKEELEYISPELFWSGKAGSSSDVYSIGILLYTGITGRLPFVTDGSNDDCAEALRRRMNGEKIKLPSFVGKKLRRVVEKAIEFSAEERYENTLELASDLKSLLVKLNADDVSKAAMEAFGKPEGELSDVEKMMLGIITSSATSDDLADVPVEEQELSEEDIEVEIEELPPEPEEPEDVESIEVEIEELPSEPEEPEDVESIEVEVEELSPEPKQDNEPQAIPLEAQPSVEEIMAELKATKLDEGAEPIEVPEFVNAPKRTIPTTSAKDTAPVKKDKKRPKAFIVILALCVILAIAAVIYNKISSKNGEGIFHVMPPVTYITPEPTKEVKESSEPVETSEPKETPEPTESPEPSEKISPYQVFTEDISWDAAEQKCTDMGGHLVAINDEEEFNKVCELLNGTNAKYAWVGCYRSSSGNYTWTNGDSIEYYNWAPNEPSVKDSYDGTAEDFIMLVRQSDGTWKYNDSRMNPVADYSYYYSGRVAYVCEIAE